MRENGRIHEMRVIVVHVNSCGNNSVFGGNIVTEANVVGIGRCTHGY